MRDSKYFIQYKWRLNSMDLRFLLFAELESKESFQSHYLKSITIYPIKSCAGFSVIRWPLCRTGISFNLLGYSESVQLFVQVLVVGVFSLAFMHNSCLFLKHKKACCMIENGWFRV